MFKRGDREYLLDIRLACSNIIEYTAGLDFDAFRSDRKTQDALVRNIEILGEAVKNISDDLKQRYPQVEWREIARTRDKLIHSYFGVDLDIIWEISVSNIPKLEKRIGDILESEGWQ